MANPNNTVPPRNPNDPQASRGGNYILPLILAVVILAIGFMFLTSGNEVDDLAATSPAAGTPTAGTMGSPTTLPNQQPINE